MNSFYINFNQDSPIIAVKDHEYHHIIHVYRHQVGDLIHISNGQGLKALGKIINCEKNSLTLSLTEVQMDTRSKVRVACAFALLKNKHDLLIVEKLTEIGINELFPLQTRHSVKIGKEKTVEKMRMASITALKQCNNAWLPEIHHVQSLEKALYQVKVKGYTPLVASEIQNTNEGLRKYIATQPSASDLCIFIGPEGGWHSQEIKHFNSLNIPQISLGKNILRAETAALVAVVQMLG